MVAQCRSWEQRRGLARVRDRRRRRQGQRVRAAAPARRGRPRAALGDRLEVPADDRGHAAAARSRWNPGKFGDLHPYAMLEPVHVAGRDDQAGDAPQRGGPRAQGHPRGRGGDRAARRRRDPAGALARARTSPSARTARRRRGRRSAARSATRRRSSRRARCSPAAPTATARAAAGSCSTHFAGGDGHRRAGGEAGDAVHGPRLGADGRRLLPARPPSRSPSSPGSARSRPRSWWRRSRRPSSSRSAACCSRSGSRRSATSPAATSPSSSARSTRCWPPTPEQIEETPGRRPEDGGRDPRAARRPADARR